MGFFYESKLDSEVVDVIRDATTDERRGIDLAGEIERLAGRQGILRTQKLQWNRLLIALAILAVLIAAAIATEATDLDTSSKALWALTSSLLGLIVGLLGGEKASK